MVFEPYNNMYPYATYIYITMVYSYKCMVYYYGYSLNIQTLTIIQ